MVIVPGWALRELSAGELHSVLLHELAHLKRRDDWTNLAQKLVGAVFFFHPAVWWLDRQLTLEREMACDDMVLAQAPDQKAYAKCLVRLAEKSVLRRGFALAQAAVRSLKQTSARVAQILDVNRSQATAVSRPAMGAVAMVAMAGVIVLPHVPRLLAFEDAAPAVVASSSVTPGPGVAVVMARANVDPARRAATLPAKSRSFAATPSQARVRASQDDKAVKSAGAVKNGEAIKNDNAASAASVAGLATKRSQAAESALAAMTLPDKQPSPMLANVTSSETIEEHITPQGVILVVHRQQVDAQGRVVWSMSVYHLTVFHPANTANQVPEKKT